MGGIVAGIPAFLSPSYNEYAASMTPALNPNPWFIRKWETTFNCSSRDISCSVNHSAVNISGYDSYVYADVVYDTVLTFAQAIQRLIGQNCPEKTGNDVRSCITGREMKEVIQNSSFYSPTGLIEFDDQGNRFSTIDFEQVLPRPQGEGFELVKVGVYDARTATITVEKNISFAYSNFEYVRADGIPESVCSYPCGPMEYTIRREPGCCWDCRTCRSNEILVDGFTGCRGCPRYTWPDATVGAAWWNGCTVV
ncbi:metabotropic glutamate receptor-like [Elysia marginata]|uniref:Metabotropic glutamate receptor-like n=1 Tax=Elysia marginata TaxID=1093978 RepID=A0AAV4EFB4_9GAST|nr:metabotropic glutamate receptor-like [Elysia marginata]